MLIGLGKELPVHDQEEVRVSCFEQLHLYDVSVSNADHVSVREDLSESSDKTTPVFAVPHLRRVVVQNLHNCM